MTKSLSRAEEELLKLVKWPDGYQFSPFEPGEKGEDPKLLLLQKVEDLVSQIREERRRDLQPLERLLKRDSKIERS